MKQLSPLPPLSLLHKLLEYNPDTGVFTWMVERGGRTARVGSPAGSTDKRGYKSIRINRRIYYAHRLAWLYVTGENPSLQIDHIDGNRSNNRAANLRQATHGQNMHNSRIKSNNTSGVKGVTWDKSTEKWCVRIVVGRRCLHLGLFRSIEDAAEVVKAARPLLHGEFCNHG